MKKNILDNSTNCNDPLFSNAVILFRQFGRNGEWGDG